MTFSGVFFNISFSCRQTLLNLTRMQPDGNSFHPFVLSIPAEAAAAAPASLPSSDHARQKSLDHCFSAHPWATRTQWRWATEPVGADPGQI